MFEPKRILIPMDFSDEAMLAWDWAVMAAKGREGVTLFPVYVDRLIPDTVALDVGRGDYRGVTRDWVDERMTNLKMLLGDAARCQPLYAVGRPAAEIVGFCENRGIDLVIMTTHGRTGISHLLHANVAEAIVREAPCPVLVLHLNRQALTPVHDTAMHRENP